jgi:3-hydroxybutyryl-CoA dehydrogenase
MKEPGINRVAVVGAGLMGYGIGLEYARFGYETALYNTKKETSVKAMAQARESLDLMAETGLITKSEADAAYNRLHPTTVLEEAVKDADFVCEAVVELLAVKKEVFGKLDKLCPPSVILATNTSSYRISNITADISHPERVVATHYFQPPHFIPLVEVGPGPKTDPQVLQRTVSLLKGMHKKVAALQTEFPGFIGNRIQVAIGKEIESLVDKGIATPEMIDDVISFGFGRRMAYTAYFKRQDLMGLDFSYNAIKERGGQPWKPLADHVEHGEFGIKTGKGFYDWTPETAAEFKRRQDIELIRLMKQDLDAGRI